MQLKKHAKNVVDPETWKKACPPKKGDQQWVDGRSAKELAKYMTETYPAIPAEMETSLAEIIPTNMCFDWDAEYVTALPGKGEGRNHDAIMFGEDIVVTIEAKADEPLGNLIAEEMKNASVNKLHRISRMLDYFFEGGFKKYPDLRYQLLTASTGTVLEAMNKGVKTAVLLVLVFKTKGNVSEEKLIENHKDIVAFLEATAAYDERGFKVIPNNTNIKLYFKEIVL